MRDNSVIYLSVVIPAYNEELRLPPTLDSIFNYLDLRDYDYEVIVVDDGSNDSTVDIVKRNPRYGSQLNLIELNNNYGKGYTVKKGFEVAKGDYIIYTDADGAAPIEELEKLLKAINDGADIAIGSRALKDSQVKDLWYRRIMGITFNTMIKIIVIGEYDDTQCGFKLFKAECARKIFDKLKLRGFSFDVELLFLAKKLGFSVSEVPIVWNSIPGTKLNLLIDSPLMFLAVLKIRIMALLGWYRFK
jgi:dolichyl-phosphate beta-glucosyltransferase